LSMLLACYSRIDGMNVMSHREMKGRSQLNRHVDMAGKNHCTESEIGVS